MQTHVTNLTSWPSPPAPPVTPTWPVAPPDPEAWPNLWARCWTRIRSWKVPPRWTLADWRDEARAQGALAACEALRDFDPARGVPRAAFLYQRVVAAAWTRYRQEWALGRRFRSIDPFPDQAEPESSHPDPELIERLTTTLDSLPDAERRLIVQRFWDGRTEDELAVAFGITRQGVNKRKRQIIGKLRMVLGTLAC
jgi:RNA polymerase sigma factor (sigma-70 family)